MLSERHSRTYLFTTLLWVLNFSNYGSQRNYQEKEGTELQDNGVGKQILQ